MRVLVVLFLCFGFIRCDEVIISYLTSSESHELSSVNISLLTNDPRLQNMLSYSGYIKVDPSFTNNYDINYFFWFFEAIESSKTFVYSKTNYINELTLCFSLVVTIFHL